LLLIAGGWQDLRTMRIANAVSVAIVTSFALWASAGLLLDKFSLSAVGWAAACAFAVFALGAAAFAGGALGGGDVKLLSATSLFAGPGLLIDFLLVTSVVGGAMALAMLAGAPIGASVDERGGTVRARLRSGLPYGPAIAAGGLWVATSLVAS
jgi:prepilin peptidase CpaA